MNQTILTADGTRLTYRETGQNLPDADPLIFQHGMGGELGQPQSYVGEHPARRVISMNARGHGDSDAITDPAQACFDTYADDVVALADQLGLDRFIMGGISLGAGTALNLTLRYPQRVSGLVLCRPAWIDRAQTPLNRDAYGSLARLLREFTVEEAVATFTQSALYREIFGQSRSAASSLLGQLTRVGAARNAVILECFPASSPSTNRETWRDITVPTLVIGHRDDPFHPYDIAQLHAELIPNAYLSTVPSKDADSAGFFAQIEAALDAFLADGARR